MTFNQDEDPKRWKAALEAKDRKIAYYEELINHEKAQHAKYMKLYFEMKEKYEKCEAITKKDIAKKVAEHVEVNNRTKDLR